LKILFYILLFTLPCANALKAQVVESILLNDSRGAKTDIVIRGGSLKATAPGFTLLPVEMGVILNTKKSWGPNLGPIWSGKGFTNTYTGGVRFYSKYLDVQIRPVFYSSQNKDFNTPEDDNRFTGPDSSKYNISRRWIDVPYRLDEAAFSRLLGGESWAKFHFKGFSTGLSTENLWWGPSKRSSIMMSSNAPGFLHASFETQKPVNLYLIDLETQIAVGLLQPSYGLRGEESGYSVIFNGIILSISPRFDKNIKLGLIRSFVLNSTDISDQTGYFPLFQPFLKKNLKLRPDGTPNDPDDQRASVFLSWHFPLAKFHIYGEYARDDHNVDLQDLYQQINHIRAYTLGFQKRWNNPNGAWSLTGELTQLQTTNTKVMRGYQSWYTHSRVRRGYTNRGEYLGSHYGHGGNGWYMGLYNTKEIVSLGLYFERVARDKDLYQEIRDSRRPAQPEIESVLGLVSWYKGKRIDLGLELNLVHISDRYYVGIRPEEGMDRQPYNLNNVNVQFTVSYKPDLRWKW
jgi:hypothetical protein